MQTGCLDIAGKQLRKEKHAADQSIWSQNSAVGCHWTWEEKNKQI